MKRREFLTLVGGAAAAWPMAARAEQPRRVGILSIAENDAATQNGIAIFVQGLASHGWTDGGNAHLIFRWTGGDPQRTVMVAKELVDLQLDAILAVGSPATAALQHETRIIPIVFVLVADPEGQGFVSSLSRPGGNVTGFAFSEPSMMGKSFEMLAQIAPGLKRVAIMYNPNTAPSGGKFFLPKFLEAAAFFKIEAIAAPIHNEAEIEAAISALGNEPGSGLAVMPDSFTYVYRQQILSLTAGHSVPTVYWSKAFVEEGGLLSYGTDLSDPYRRSASYVNRILRGEKASELPVEYPVKFEMAVNTRTAKTLKLTIPESILLSADEVIE